MFELAQKNNKIVLPLMPQSIQQLAWGLSLFFSTNEQERKYGESIKSEWDNLVKNQKARDKTFLDNVNAIMSGSIYSLAQLRKQVNDQFKFLDSLKARKIKNLENLANLSKDAESIATRIAGISLGGGSISFLGIANNVFGPNGFLAFIVGGGISYLVLEIILRKYCNDQIPKIMEETQKRKEKFLSEEFKPKSEDVLKELLQKVNEISEELYAEEYEKLTDEKISTLSSNSATVTSSSYLTGGTISPFVYFGERAGSDYYGGGAIDTKHAGKILRTNYESETDEQSK